jgi:Dolichyl-phosphate-mannose-protein mannosyltransferase
VTATAQGQRDPDLAWNPPAADADSDPSLPAEPSRTSTGRRRFWHPLIAVCGVQAALSLALVWSNTAYIDEADYLWVGHLVIRNWLHGTSWPASLIKSNLSGSPFLYPPIGAMADSVGGLAGARILSMLFMLGATIVLYCTAQRLFGRPAALIAAILWALSEPAFRLAYATYDPLSVFLTTISAWLIVQATCRRRSALYAIGAAVVLALANATAYSGIVIDPVVVAFALAVWWPELGPKRALIYTASVCAGLLASFAAVLAVTGSWSGTGTIFHRQSLDHESVALVLREIWSYSGFLMALALLGVLVAFKLETRARAVLVTLVGLAVFTAPIAQFHYGTAWSADKHVAYGFWFAVMAAGYGCAKLIAWPAGRVGQSGGRKLIAVGAVIALIYPAAYGFEAAWQRYHLWPNSAAFVTALRPVIAHSSGIIYVPGHEQNIAQYYLPEGMDWQRWSSSLALDPAGLPKPVPRSDWPAYYRKYVASGRYQYYALFYDTTFTSSVALSPKRVASGRVTRQRLLKLVAANSDEAGVPILTNTLENSHKYRLVGYGPYNITNVTGSHNYGIFVIWKRVSGS